MCKIKITKVRLKNKMTEFYIKHLAKDFKAIIKKIGWICNVATPVNF